MSLQYDKNIGRGTSMSTLHLIQSSDLGGEN